MQYARRPPRLQATSPPHTVTAGVPPASSVSEYDVGMKRSPTEPVPAERSSMDDVLDVYRRDLDMTLLRENLKLTPDERSRKFEDFMLSLAEIRGAATRR